MSKDERPIESNGLWQWLIHHAAHRAPESLSSRLEEEWLADLQSRSSSLSRLRFALGCCWATLVIANDYPRRQVAAARAVAGPMVTGGSVTLVERNFRYFSLRSGTLFLIAGLHAALFFGLVVTLSHTRATTPPPILQNRTIEDVPRKKDPVVPSLSSDDRRLSVPRPDVPLPPLRLPSEDVTTTVDGTQTEPPLPPQLPFTPEHVVARVAGGPGAGFPDTADFYPSIAIHMGEQGMSTVRVCVDPRGRLTSDPTTVQGSGSMRLDQAALKLARAASGHYRASTEDGHPVDSCYPLGIRFQLKSQ
jgi:TonB family protein